MKKRISRVNPLQLGKVLGVLQACVALIFVPFAALAFLVGISQRQSGAAAGAIVLLILAPVFYGAIGFVFGAIGGATYNLIAGWTGGIEFTLTDVAPTLPGVAPYGTIRE